MGKFENELYFDYDGIKFILNHKKSAYLLDLPDLSELPDDAFNLGDLVKFKVLSFDKGNRMVYMEPFKEYQWHAGSKLNAEIVEVESDFIKLQNYAGLQMYLSKENLSCFPVCDLRYLTDFVAGKTIEVEIIAPNKVRYVPKNEQVFYHGCSFMADIVSITDRMLTLCCQGYYAQIMESGPLHISESVFSKCSMKELFHGQVQLPVEVVSGLDGLHLVVAQYSRPEIYDNWTLVKHESQYVLMKCKNSFGMFDYTSNEELPASLILRAIKIDEEGFFYLKKDYEQLVNTMLGQTLKCTILSVDKDIVMTYKPYPFIAVSMPLKEYSWDRDKPLVGTTVECQVINVNSTLLSITVSRKAILMYTHSLTKKGETITLKVKGKLRGHFVLQGNGIHARLPYNKCLCYNVNDCHDLIADGDLVRCRVQSIYNKNYLKVSLNALCKSSPWTDWLKDWHSGEIHPFRVVQIGNKFLYIRTKNLIVALDLKYIFLHPTYHCAKDEFNKDQIVNVEILDIDCDSKRIEVRIVDYFTDKLHSFENGQVVVGKVMSVTKKGILLNSNDACIYVFAGEISPGILKYNEIPFKIGEFVQAIITDYIEQDDVYIGSVKQLLKDEVSPLSENQLCEVMVKSLGTDHADVEFHGYHGLITYKEAGIKGAAFAKRFPIGTKLYAILSKIEYNINRLQFSLLKISELIEFDYVYKCEVIRVNKKSITVSFLGIEKKIELSNLKVLPENNVDILLFYHVNQLVEVKVDKLIPTESILTLKVNANTENWKPVNSEIGSIISNAKIIAISEICAYMEKDNQLIRVSKHDFFWNQEKSIKDYYQVGKELDVKIVEHKEYYSVGNVNDLKIGTEQDIFKEINIGDIIEVVIKDITGDCLICSYDDSEVIVYKDDVYWYGEPVSENNLLNDFVVGQHVQVKVFRIKRNKQFVRARIKDISPNPFEENKEGDEFEGEVIKVDPKYYIVKWDKGLGLLKARLASMQRTNRLNPELRYQIGEKIDVAIYRLNEKTHVISLTSKAIDENVFKEGDLKEGNTLKGRICNLTEKGVLLDLGRSLRVYVPAYRIYFYVGNFERLSHMFADKRIEYIDTVLSSIDIDNKRVTVNPTWKKKLKYNKNVNDEVKVYIIDAIRNSLTVRTEDGFYGYIDCTEVDYKVQIPISFRSSGDVTVAHKAVYLGQDDYGVPRFSMKKFLNKPYKKYLTTNYRCHGKVLGSYNSDCDNPHNKKLQIFVELEDAIGMIFFSNKRHKDRIDKNYFMDGEEHEFISVGVSEDMVMLSYLPDQFVKEEELEASLISMDNDYIYFEIEGEHTAYASVSKKDPVFIKAFTNNLGVLSDYNKGKRCLLRIIKFDPLRRLGIAEFVRVLDNA